MAEFDSGTWEQNITEINARPWDDDNGKEDWTMPEQTNEVVIDRYIAVHPGTYGGSYGTGSTIEEAKANLKKHGGKLNKVIIYRLPERVTRAHVNNFGGIHWTFVDEADAVAWRSLSDDEQQLEVVHRRGIPAPKKGA